MTLAQHAVRIALGTAMVGAGVTHLTVAREEFRAQVPEWFPVDEDLTVLGSGVVEIGLGAAFVALPKRRRLVGGLLAAFFVAIFPGNIAQYVEGTDAFGLDTDQKPAHPAVLPAGAGAAGPVGRGTAQPPRPGHRLTPSGRRCPRRRLEFGTSGSGRGPPHRVLATLHRKAPVQPNCPVLVDIDGAPVPGLLLKAAPDGSRLLVTFEQDGRVATTWLPVEQVRIVER